MTPGADADSRIHLWWAAIGAGLVVTVCVVILLTLLAAFVRDIERHLRTAADEARGAAAHVRAAELTVVAAGLIDDLGTELALQVAVLTRNGGGRT